MKLPASRPGSMKRFSYRRLVRVACSVAAHTVVLHRRLIKYTPSLCLRSTVHEFKELFYRSGEEPEDTRHQT